MRVTCRKRSTCRLGGFRDHARTALVALRSPCGWLRVVIAVGWRGRLRHCGVLRCAAQPCTILHLVGMLLIVAVGSNYALFFDRSSTEPDARRWKKMRHERWRR